MSTEAVFLFDYEGNPDLMEIAVKNARLSSYFDDPSVISILFITTRNEALESDL